MVARRTCRSDKPGAQRQDSRMYRTRKSTSRRRATGLLVGLVAYLILLQGLATAYAKTWTAVDQFEPAFIICSPSQAADRTNADPLDQIVKECCTALCVAASTVGPTLQPSETGTFRIPPIRTDDEPLYPTSHRAPPGEPGAIKDARAPPDFSI